jgi:hypothetical protein
MSILIPLLLPSVVNATANVGKSSFRDDRRTDHPGLTLSTLSSPRHHQCCAGNELQYLYQDREQGVYDKLAIPIRKVTSRVTDGDHRDGVRDVHRVRSDLNYLQTYRN